MAVLQRCVWESGLQILTSNTSQWGGAGSCEYGNKPSGSTRFVEFLARTPKGLLAS
jgi:hypothetical protein